MKCWGSEVKNVLSINGFNWVWLQQGVGNDFGFLKVNWSKDSDNFVPEWNATIREKDRYLPYHSDKIIFEPEKYISLLDIYCFRVGLCTFRLGVLPINNTLHRYSLCPAKRKCVFCVTAVDDEEHLLFTCPLYADIRMKLLKDTSENASTSSLLNVNFEDQEKYVSLSKVYFQCDEEKNIINL